MQATCTYCQKILEFSGDAPLCAYCGQPLAVTQEFVLGSNGNEAATLPLPTAGVDTATLPPAAAGIARGIPETVGGFKLLRKLGGGGMGTVYEAEDAASGRRVALKLVLPEYATSPDALLRFQQEGRLASSLSHPRCVFVLTADEDDGRPFIVMELMPGHTLDDLIREKGPLSPEQAITKILDVIDGLQEAHRLGLVHRDVKPSNCFVDTDGRIKIGDFGLARSLVRDSKLTRTGTFIGTPLFASPEQIKMETVDAQSDLYAVAATLYFLLTGKAPFQGGDMMSAMARIVSDDPPRMRSLHPKLSRALDKVVLRGLQRDRRRRWRDLDEFRRALIPFLPAQPSISGTGLRLGAHVIDYFVSVFLSAAAGLLILHPLVQLELVPAPTGIFDPSIQGMATGTVAFVGYYTLMEGLLGWSVGKRLLRLRVAPVGENRPPGLKRGLVRTLIFYTMFNIGAWITILGWLALEIPTDRGEWTETQTIQMAILGAINISCTLLACVLTLSTMRASNGYRGLHEIWSGTRTYRLHWPQPQRRRAMRSRPFELDVSMPAGMPERVGPFRVLGALRWTDRERTLLAEDVQLGRKLWIWLRPAAEPPLDASRRNIGRATRIRWVSCGALDDWQWDAFLAPGGAPLPALAACEPRLSWAEVRPVLEDLTEELAASCADGTLPHSLSLYQLWVQPHGKICLLGTPLQGTDSHVAGRTTEVESATATEAERALDFLRRVAVTALEGKARADADWSGPVRAPVPVHASQLLDILFAQQESGQVLERWQIELEATRDRPTEITHSRRAMHLGLITLLLHIPVMGPVLLVLLPGILLTRQWRRNPTELPVGYVIIWVLTVVWVLWAFIFRGGYGFWRGGIQLRRADGRPATRLQCGWRALLVWGPIALVLSLALTVATIWPELPVVYFALYAAGVLLMPLYGVLAVRYPNRSLHDYLAGTYLVPE